MGPSKPVVVGFMFFMCECVEHDGTKLPRKDYIVTGHDGSVALCSYCDECAALARVDWNGETAAIEEAS